MIAEQKRAFQAAVKAHRESNNVQVTTLGVVVAMEAFGLVPHPYDASKRNREAEARLQAAIVRWSEQPSNDMTDIQTEWLVVADAIFAALQAARLVIVSADRSQWATCDLSYDDEPMLLPLCPICGTCGPIALPSAGEKDEE